MVFQTAKDINVEFHRNGNWVLCKKNPNNRWDLIFKRRVRDSNPRYLSVQQFFSAEPRPQSHDRRNLGNSICLKPIISINGFEELFALKCRRLRFKFFLIVQTKWRSRLRALNQPVIMKLQSSL